MTLKGITHMLQYCPMCGQKLETHPVNHNKACFVHGDFLVKRQGKTQIVEFVPTRKWRDELAQR